MGIDTEREIEANLQIGPTDKGMVRLFIEAEGGIEIPMDFTPDEAVEIAEEIMPLRAQNPNVEICGAGVWGQPPTAQKRGHPRDIIPFGSLNCVNP